MNDKKFKILVVDDERQYVEVINMILQSEGYDTTVASSGEEALEKFKKEKFNLVLSDLQMDGINGIQVLEEIKKNHKNTFVILITGYGTIKNAVEAIKKGAFSYIIKGSNPADLLSEIEKVKKECKVIVDEEPSDFNSEFLLKTNNPKLKKILEIAKKAAAANVNVLITGESGTGKEVMARYIYENSERKDKKFVAVNCQSFSSTLLESELFGHEKGAFTGAINKRIGRFEEAHGGTLFLDEVGDIDLNTQVKLLRALENRTIEKIGSNKSIDVDFRLICATNKDLETSIEKKEFREDLFYRINTISIHLPSLRERKEDLPMLIDFFLKKSAVKYNKEIFQIDDKVMKQLLEYEYKGNIRELKNILDKLVILSEQGHIKYEFYKDKTYVKEESSNLLNTEDIKPLKEIKREAEAEYIKKVLDILNGNITKSAEYLDISRRQLFNKIVEYKVKEKI